MKYVFSINIKKESENVKNLFQYNNRKNHSAIKKAYISKQADV